MEKFYYIQNDKLICYGKKQTLIKYHLSVNKSGLLVMLLAIIFY